MCVPLASLPLLLCRYSPRWLQLHKLYCDIHLCDDRWYSGCHHFLPHWRHPRGEAQKPRAWHPTALWRKEDCHYETDRLCEPNVQVLWSNSWDLNSGCVISVLKIPCVHAVFMYVQPLSSFSTFNWCYDFRLLIVSTRCCLCSPLWGNIIAL